MTSQSELPLAALGRTRLMPLVTIERLDITEPDQIAALHDRLSGSVFDMLFVNAGTANHDQAETIAQTSTDEFVRVMLTNALGVMRAVEGLQDRVRPA